MGMEWRRKWQPTPVFLPGESHGQKSLAGYSAKGPKELDMTEMMHAMGMEYLLILSIVPMRRGAVAVTIIMYAVSVQREAGGMVSMVFKERGVDLERWGGGKSPGPWRGQGALQTGLGRGQSLQVCSCGSVFL